VTAVSAFVITAIAQYHLLIRLSALESEVLQLTQQRAETIASDFRDGSGLPLPKEPISLEGAAVKGNLTARVVMIEFADFECDFCGRFVRETLPALERDYVATGKVRLAFRHLPLSRAHSHAEDAAQAAECAGRQGHFWEMYDQLFHSQTHLEIPDLKKRATQLQLNEAQFSACLSDRRSESIARDLNIAAGLGVVGTPTFLIGIIQSDGRARIVQTLVGARPLRDFADALDKALTHKDASRQSSSFGNY
jgi:protein-disulfide isomerase